MIKQAVESGARMVLLPELWSSGYDLNHARQHCATNLALLDEIGDLARETNTWIGGTWLLAENDRIHNSFVLLPPGGQPVIAYHKVHLFPLMDEPRFLTAGNTIQTVMLEDIPTGLAVCYDLRFPELFRMYARQNAVLLLIAAEWPLSRIMHWQILLQARAIENQCFVAGVNCTGRSGAATFGGCSAVFSPNGSCIMRGSRHSPQVMTTTLDLDEVHLVRANMPALDGRREDLY